MTLQDQIKQIMDKKQITSYQISKNCGIDESQLSKFFRGKASLSLFKIQLILDYIGCKLKVMENNNCSIDKI